MPKNKVSDPITDQEIAFARLVLSGTMTDRRAAEAVGLNPGSAAYTKAKPRVRAYMLDHRAAVKQELVQKEAEGLHRLNLDREQVLTRLWEIANLSPEMTRGSVTGQVKALSMIIAMENFIPDRRGVPSEKNSPTAPTAEIYASAWRRQQATTPATTNDPQPTPAPPVPACRGDQEEAQKEDSPAVPACPGVPWKPEFAPASAVDTPPPLDPYGPGFSFVPDARGPFSIPKNPFARRR